MKFSILGLGGIAQTMAGTVSALKDRGIERYAAASRDMEKAEAFAKQWGFSKAYGSYEELVEDPEVELVYVATPHSHHYQYAKLCLEHGKHVLVEKAFTVNAAQAEELVSLAREKGLLLAEAIWPRYMPRRKLVDELIESGVIGRVTSLTAELGYPLAEVERMKNPALAGGALLDLTVYPLNFALMAFHSPVKDVVSTAVLSPEGVDWMDSITLTFEDGRVAVLHTNMLANVPSRGVINGDKGNIEVHNLNGYGEVRVYDLDGNMTAHYPVPEDLISGYEFEVLSCKRAIGEGRTECEEMPHAETLRVMRLMDRMRAQWGMKYPCE